MDEIGAEANVFSYSTMAAPTQRKTFGVFTYDACMSYLLVFATLAVQGVLLFCVYDKVVVNNAHWVAGIMKTGEDWAMFQPEADGCNDGQSLCTINNGTYSCAPPSIQLTGRWDELDVNGDGIWTRAEVFQTRKHIKCKYVVDPLEIFEVFKFLLLQREKYIWIHPDLRAGNAIHKAYFTYVMGDVAMCGYRSQDMCTNLLKRGVFHAALKYGNAPRIGTSIESALDYCREMLAPMGICERILPSTYATWKLESVVQCEKPKYKKFVYENPANGIKKSLLEVDYKARQKYELAQSVLFQVYKGMICCIWGLLIVHQLRIVFKVMSWVVQFPATEAVDEETRVALIARSRSGTDHARAEGPPTGISLQHRLTMAFVTLLRITMLCILLYVGLSFLGRQTDYIGLLMDGVALIFIIQVQEIFYEHVIRADVRKHWEEAEEMTVQKVGIPLLQRRPDIVDMLWFFIVVGLSVAFMYNYTKTIVNPLHDSLECACLGEGKHCFEATRFSKEFWDQYWKFDIPSVYTQINSLKSGFTAWGANFDKGSMRRRFANSHEQPSYQVH
jgi:hypothetical protein